MPIVKIHILEGRDTATKHELIRNVSRTVEETLKVPAESIRVILQEMPPDHYGVAGLPVMEYRLKKSRDR